MNGGDASRGPRTSAAVPAILMLIVLAGLIGLGNWQLDRKVWKEALVAKLTQRLAAAPSELPPPQR